MTDPRVEQAMIESGFEPSIPPTITRARAGSLLMALAGPIIYTVYFFAGYLLVEAGCGLGILQGNVGGFPLLSVVLVGLTAVTLVALLAVAAVQFFRWRRVRHNIPTRAEVPVAEGAPVEDDERDLPFLLVVGAGLALLFAWVTISTGFPILVLEPCSWW
jgi:hypothetical protein